MGLQTEYQFTLPNGYVDDEGALHRTGAMRLACARDEIEPLRDPRVRENEAYATVIVLARVIAELGTVTRVTTKTVESLFVRDFGYLQDLYRVDQLPGSQHPRVPGARHPFPEGLVGVG